MVPWERGDVIAAIHREGQVVSTAEGESGMTIRARLSEASTGRLEEWLVSRPSPTGDDRKDQGSIGQNGSVPPTNTVVEDAVDN